STTRPGTRLAFRRQRRLRPHGSPTEEHAQPARRDGGDVLLHPQLKKEEAAKDLILEGYQEHHVMDLLIDGISCPQTTDEAWQPKIKVLQENTEHHIEEEEGELFPKVRKIWDTEPSQQVGRQMQDMKSQRHKEQKAA